MTQNKNIQPQKGSKVVKTKIVVKPYYKGNKSLIDAFTEVIIKNIEKKMG
ncbi:hypothetical protein [Clostridium lundense]|nr:hypothetical protein [Clostridium lundense]